jgi:large subunit ribosomal protein L19
MAKIPEIKPGDLVKVYTKIKEGDKERITPFQGVVIKMKGSDVGKTFTVRKISAGVGIERIFPLNSPIISKIEIKKTGKVRRAKLNYLRKRKGRKIKVKEVALKSKKPSEKKSEELPDEKESTPEQPAVKKSEGKTGEGAPRQKTVEKT